MIVQTEIWKVMKYLLLNAFAHFLFLIHQRIVFRFPPKSCVAYTR